MNLFSQRRGIKLFKSVIQVDDMDDDLRNDLWNALTISYWDNINRDYISYFPDMENLIKKLWVDHFKQPLDTLEDTWSLTYEKIRNKFYDYEWYEVYDFIEFIASSYPCKNDNQNFMDLCNSFLKRELSAYRFIGGKITQITSEEEILEIEEALEISKPLKAVNTHLKTALDLLADRKSPNYRNSIKESISAVEAICNLITKGKNVTLGQALKKIEDKVGLHSALKNAFSSLYGYTSDADGIRHALLDEPNLDFEDAKFMLVSCSTFINYLAIKASKAEIKI